MERRFLEMRDDGQWLIKDRLIVRDWSISHRIDLDPLSQRGIVEGTPGPRDASYRALGQENGFELFRPRPDANDNNAG